MKLSKAGLEFLKGLEGFKAKAYKDGKGYSIGYGHFIQKSESVLLKKTITKSEAEILLLKDVARFENYVNQKLPWFKTQYEFDALVMRAFNVGSLGSKFIDALKQRDMDRLFKVWKTYNHSEGKVHDGLTARIEKEISYFKGYGNVPSDIGFLPIIVFGVIGLKALNII